MAENSIQALTVSELQALTCALEIRNMDLNNRLIAQAQAHQDDIQRMGDELESVWSVKLNREIQNANNLARDFQKLCYENEQAKKRFDLHLEESTSRSQSCIKSLQAKVKVIEDCFRTEGINLGRVLHSVQGHHLTVLGFHHPKFKLFHLRCRDCDSRLTTWDSLDADQQEVYEDMGKSVLDHLARELGYSTLS